MAQGCIIISYLITFVVIQVVSQTVWVDVDNGKILGVTQGQGQEEQRSQQQYPQRNNGYYRRRHHWHQQYNSNQPPYIQQTINPNANNVDPEWVCRNSKTGDTMIIASEINTRVPEQTQPNYSQQPLFTFTPNVNNPWLGANGQPTLHNNPDGTVLGPNNPQNPIDNGGNIANPYPTVLSTEAPVILTTKSTTRSPFPTLGDIDWSKYIETTTKKTNAPNLDSAIDGQGIIMARNGDGRA